MAAAQQQTTAITPLNSVLKTLATREWHDKIAAALPAHVKPERMLRVIQTALGRNPELAECTKTSLFGSIVMASQLGLEVNTPLGHAYLLPFRNGRTGQRECQLIIGYTGYIDLAWRSDRVLDVYAEVVREGDEFVFEMGLERKLVHKPKFGNQGPLKFVYAVCHIKGGGVAFVVLDKAEVMNAKSSSKSPRTVWETENEPAMWKKTAIRQLRKWIPQSVEFATAAALEDALDRGETQQAVYDTTFTEVAAAPQQLPQQPQAQRSNDLGQAPSPLEQARARTQQVQQQRQAAPPAPKPSAPEPEPEPVIEQQVEQEEQGSLLPDTGPEPASQDEAPPADQQPDPLAPDETVLKKSAVNEIVGLIKQLGKKPEVVEAANHWGLGADNSDPMSASLDQLQGLLDELNNIAAKEEEKAAKASAGSGTTSGSGASLIQAATQAAKPSRRK